MGAPNTTPLPEIEAASKAACKSGKFECGQGVCAPICMQYLGNPRKRGCGEAVRVHGAFVTQILQAAAQARGEKL